MMAIDPETFAGALIVGVILILLERILAAGRKRDKEESRVAKDWPTGKLSSLGRLFMQLRYGRGLRRFLVPYREEIKGKVSRELGSTHYAEQSVLPQASGPLGVSLAGNGIAPSLPVVDAAEQFAHMGLLLLGESGAGKSTSMKRIALHYCTNQEVAPIVIELRNYRQTNSLMMLMAREVKNRTWLERGLKLGRFLLLFDGLNEVPQELTPSLVADLGMLMAEFPANGVIVSCRPNDYSDGLPSFAHMRIQPLDKQTIRQYLNSVLDANNGDRLFANLDNKLLGLCSNPHMLSMLASTYRATGKLPSNRAKLYESFLIQFLVKESTKPFTGASVAIKHDLLSDLAFYMGNEVVTVDIARAQNIIGRKLILLKETTLDHNYFAPDVLDELLSIGLIREDFGNISFMHQSIQEFYTARELAERLSSGDMKMVEVGHYVEDSRWQETIALLAGLLKDATDLVKAVRKKDQLLASECIYASDRVDPVVVDEAIVHFATEFKFGNEPFNYSLIFSLVRIGERRSKGLPQRVIDDVEHWCRKFASSTPRTLVGRDTDELLKIVTEETSPYIVLDAIWTLGVRKEVRAVPRLIEILLDRNSPFRTDAARSLGHIGDKRATAALLTCVEPSEPQHLRPFCFMALGSIGDPGAYKPIMDYIVNDQNPYRETAAWALLGVADESIADFLIENLRVGPAYLRAIYVYLLWRFKIDSGLEPLIELMADEHSAFVREDIAFALGEYGDERASPVLISRLKDSDALVRARVVEALGKIGSDEAIPKIKEVLDDGSVFVRESAAAALRRICKETP